MAFVFRRQTLIFARKKKKTPNMEQSCFTRSASFHPPADHKVSAAVCTCVRQLCVKQPFPGKKKAANQADPDTSKSNTEPLAAPGWHRRAGLHGRRRHARVTLRLRHQVGTVRPLMYGILVIASSRWFGPHPGDGRLLVTS